MNKRIFQTFIFLLFSIIMKAQEQGTTSEIPINTDVFVQLVFKSPIQTVKTGAPDLIVSDYQDNSLTLQAIGNEVKTNIVVKTSDGLYYSYILLGEENVDKVILFYEIESKNAINNKTTSSSSDADVEIKDNKKDNIKKDKNSQEVAEEISNLAGWIKNRNIGSYSKISLKIKGIYAHDEKIYFLLELTNDSNIDYQIEKLQFATLPIDKSKKRVQSEEKEYIPLYYHNYTPTIERKSKRNIVAVFQKFTINKNKFLEMILNEVSGERTVRLNINSKWILEAKKINN